MPPNNLGAIERQKDSRDILLGSVQAPVTIPATYLPDMSWMKRNYQAQTPTCGAHAASHLQAILEHANTPTANQRYSPRYLWTKIKQIDGFPLDAGTDMRSILKVLQNTGADDFEPLENDILLPLATYSSPSAITPAMDADASGNKINSYAFDSLTYEDICQTIYQEKAILILAKVDDGFLGTATPTFTKAEYGHFFTGYGYDKTTNDLLIVDSADPSDQLAFKRINAKYITGQFFFETGSGIVLPPAVKQALVTQTPLPASVTQAISAGHLSIAEQIIQDIEFAVGLIRKEIGQI